MARKNKQESFDALGGFEAETPAQEGRLARAAMWIVGVVGVLAAAYVGTAYYIQDKVATGTTVMGSDIGGLDASAAVAKLSKDLDPQVTEPVEIVADDRSAEIEPAESGLGVNYEATVQGLTGFSLDPTRIWPHIVGAGPVEPVLDVDRTALTRTLTDLAPSMEVEPTDGVIDLSSGAPQITDAIDGVTLDIQASVDQLTAAWPYEVDEPVELVTTSLEPFISNQDIEDAMEAYVRPLLAGPIRLSVQESSHEVTTEEMAMASALVPTEQGTLELEIDGTEIRERIVEESPELGNPGANAHFVFEEGRPVVVPSEPGLGLEAEAVSQAVRDAALSATRAESVSLTEMEPDFTTEDAEALGIVEVVSEFKTPYPYDPTRTLNLRAGQSKINGILVKPGETFSLLDTLKPISAANGYHDSGVVEGGVATTALGGGLSQISTNTYNAAYFAGMDIIEHKPHSRWFSRYPEGRESTVWDPSVDMKFTNNTPYGVLLQAWVQDDGVVTRAWSTKYFEVESYTSPRRNFTSPTVIYSDSPRCTPERGGQSGFTVDVTRVRKLDGEEFDRTTNTWTYAPWNQVVCGPRPTDPPPETAAAPAEPEPPADGGAEDGGEGSGEG
ncbi:MAG TPA: vanomycin resistance protein VanB [Actinomycetales bacterium]|nr:vanomycin resistance protein VanB [Actinomycetales bacterium]